MVRPRGDLSDVWTASSLKCIVTFQHCLLLLYKASRCLWSVLIVLYAGAEWYSYIDFLKWGWHSQMINQFEDYPEGKPLELVLYS